VHARFLRPLPDAAAERYYLESMRIAEVLGVPLSMQPPTLADFRAYVRHMVGSLEVSEEARQVADAVFHPRSVVLQPAFRLAQELTAGLLPDPLRRGFRLSWDPPRQAVLLAAAMASRQVLPRLNDVYSHHSWGSLPSMARMLSRTQGPHW
jgi:uncharacterized protein (DUF2236 family)